MSRREVAGDRLPARDLVDVRLADAMAAGGCPICTVRDRAEAGTLDAILGESVSDRTFRAELDDARGFCRRHSRLLIAADRRQTGGMLGTVILHGAVLKRRLPELREALAADGRRARKRVEAAAAAPRCPVCDQIDRSVATSAGRMHILAADEAWADALATAAFCLDDLLVVWAEGPSDGAWRAIAERQLERLDDLVRRLDGFAHHSSHDRRHLLTDGERAAGDEATRLLGGDAPG
jgi:hypothetical protein